MKKNEVPQDDANMLEGKLREPCYAVDEKGNYMTVPSVGWEPKNVVMQQAWDHINEGIEKVLERVKSGSLSPLAYYMEKNQLDVKLMAKYVGLSRRKVRSHLKPNIFAKLKDNIYEKYAEVLKITVEELKSIRD